MYDYLIVGAGLFGSIFAYEAKNRGKKCLIIDKRNHLGGNIYTENIENIEVHKYGPHIFHTNNKFIWEFIQKFAEFNKFIYSPIANYKGEIYSLPFNMYTFNKIWGNKVITPDEAKRKIDEQVNESKIKEPQNLEEQAISLVGKDIYEKLIKGYTEKQWGKKATELPAFIIKRLPVRYKYDNNYFNDIYQGIPIGGYTNIIKKMLDGIEIILEKDFFEERKKFESMSKKIVFTGRIDEFYEYKFGKLEYRSLRFETEILNSENYQGNAAVNYTDYETPYTRIIEHKHFEYGKQKKTVITKEYPQKCEYKEEPYYPINDIKNNSLYKKYAELASKEKNIIFGGRLGQYRYYDMDDVILEALKCTKKELE